MKTQWWGRVRDDAPDAPLHLMLDRVDVMRRSACEDRPGNGQIKAMSAWPPDISRCGACMLTGDWTQHFPRTSTF
jgi:hypothetical protein